MNSVIVLFDPNEKNVIRAVYAVPAGKTVGDADTELNRIFDTLGDDLSTVQEQLELSGYETVMFIPQAINNDQ